jgi:hypothetical protein
MKRDEIDDPVLLAQVNALIAEVERMVAEIRANEERQRKRLSLKTKPIDQWDEADD